MCGVCYSRQPLWSLLPLRCFVKRKLHLLGPDRTGQMCAETYLFLLVRGKKRRKREGEKQNVRTGKGKAETFLAKLKWRHTCSTLAPPCRVWAKEESGGGKDGEESCLLLMRALMFTWLIMLPYRTFRRVFPWFYTANNDTPPMEHIHPVFSGTNN